MVASLFQVLIGFSGVMGFVMKFIGPLSIAPTIALAGLALFDVATRYACTAVVLLMNSSCLFSLCFRTQLCEGAVVDRARHDLPHRNVLTVHQEHRHPLLQVRTGSRLRQGQLPAVPTLSCETKNEKKNTIEVVVHVHVAGLAC